MKKLFFLIMASVLLSGCFITKSQDSAFTPNNLRAPERTVYTPPTPPQKEVSAVPQSITQPLPLPAPSTPAPQQPLVQTIVIPQYMPNMGGYGAGMPVQNLPGMNAYPMQNAAVSTPVAPVSNPVVPAPAPIAPVSVPVVADNPLKEAVYPAWASADYKTPTVVDYKSNDMVYFKHPSAGETVECASVDVMCISSYRQQGYIPVSDKNGFARKEDAGYPRTAPRETESNAFPRW